MGAWSLLLSCCLILSLTRGAAFDEGGRATEAKPSAVDNSEVVFVNPTVMNMASDDRQPMQLLDAAGLVITDADWAVVDGSVAEIWPAEDNEPASLHAKSPGQTKIIATSGGRSASAEVAVFSKGTRPDGVLRWAAPALPGARGDLSNIVQSLRIDDTTPDLYVGDGVRIRAFNQDGQQRWVWPISEGPESVRLLAGDDRGGAVVLVTEGRGKSIICLDSKGQQSWIHRLGSEFDLSDYAIDRTGLVYLLEDQNQGRSQVVALEPDSGQKRFVIPLPTSVKAAKNWENKNVRGHLVPACALGRDTSPRGS